MPTWSSLAAARRLGIACALLASACSSSPSVTGVVVRVEADSMIATEATTLVIRVYGTVGSGSEVLREERSVPLGTTFMLPYTIGVRPLAGDATRTYRVEAEIRAAAGTALATSRVIGSYLPGRVLSVVLHFDDLCRDVRCDDVGQTCRGALCVDAHVDVTGLPDFGDDAGGPPPPVCDGGAPSTCYVDGDRDGYAPGHAVPVTTCGCPVGSTLRAPGVGSTDCNDADGLVNPMATEICDVPAVDEDCDGIANPAAICG